MFEAIAAIAGLLATLAGLIRWLLAVWHKNIRDNERLKNELRLKEIESIKLALSDFETKLDIHAKRLSELEAVITTQTSKFKEATEGFTRISAALKAFVKQSETNTKELRQAMVKISEEIFIIKGTKSAQN